MTSGNSFTEKEDIFILQHMKGLYPSDIAKELSVKYPEENGGHRSYWGVRDRMILFKDKGVTLETLHTFRNPPKDENEETPKNKGGRPKRGRYS